MTDIEVFAEHRKLTTEQLFQLLTPENKDAVIRQIELLLAAQSSGQ